MARLESIAVAGYYPTPASVLPGILARLGILADRPYAFLDPCAGEGEALTALVSGLYARAYPDPSVKLPHEAQKVYAIEMEETRHRNLRDRLVQSFGYNNVTVLHGDAFQSRWSVGEKYSNRGISCLYLNPPYDTDLDPTVGRLEERFLRRFTGALMEGGVCVFVVPFYALKWSAETIATHYQSAVAFRFPDAEFAAYKQVVVFARKRGEPLLSPDPALLARVQAWAADSAAMPVLTPESPVLGYLPVTPTAQNKWNGKTYGDGYESAGLHEFTMVRLDEMTVLEKFRPWETTTRTGQCRPMSLVLPDPKGEGMFSRLFPMAVPPKPAHIAAGLAAGVFNGERIAADVPLSGAPDVLLKGVFDREFECVEEKENKDGDKVGEVQVQQPRLVVTVLDLTTHEIHTIQSSPEVTGTTDPAKMTTGDVLTLYGRSLLNVLRQHCPILYDPANPAQHFALPTLKRPLYKAQEHTVRACLMLLGGPGVPVSARAGKAVVLLGEIGCGKTGCAIATALGAGARRILSLVPPHLLTSWERQVQQVYPMAETRILSTVADVQAFDALTTPDVVIGLMSREAAKLGHGWEGIAPLTEHAPHSCPKCGAPVPKVDLAKKRARCEAVSYAPRNKSAELMIELALLMAKVDPRNGVVGQVLSTGPRSLRAIHRKALKAMQAAEMAGKGTEYQESGFQALRTNPRTRALAFELAGENLGDFNSREDNALLNLLVALNDHALTAEIAERMYTAAAIFDPESYGVGSRRRDEARRLLLLLPAEGELQTAVADRLRAFPMDHASTYSYGSTSSPWANFAAKVRSLAGAGTGENFFWELRRKEGAITYQEKPLGSVEFLSKAVDKLWSHSGWDKREGCGEALFQAVGTPMRYPLATYLSRFAPKSIDFLILDEGHEYSTDGSAQERAAHRLTNLRVPTMLLTGSIMNGYAESLFSNWWALFPTFRLEFRRDQRPDFVRRYGYRKRYVQDKDRKTGDVVEYGSQSDRVERNEIDMGNAPGVLPLFVLRMLANCVTLHKTDLELDLPPCVDIPVVVPTIDAQREPHVAMVQRLMRQIKADKFVRERAGKLWGQMNEAPSQLDRCTADAGNTPEGVYEIRYPKKLGNGLVTSVAPLPASTLLPKEAEMLRIIEEGLKEGRNTLVFTWHVELMPRIARLIAEKFGLKVPVLYPEKVPPQKREAWIDKHVVGAKSPVLVTNPMCVQTGLNNLVWFPTQWWHENPATNPIIFRQGRGRSDRIGQDKDVRIYYPIYDVASQKKAHQLLLHKVAVSMATDGLNAESALQAAGVGETNVSGFSIGQELYRMLENETW